MRTTSTTTISDLGRDMTELLPVRGDRVAATSRIGDLGDYGDRLWRVELDVTDTECLRKVIDSAFAELGRIDVVISNAGYGLIGLAEEVSDEQNDRQLESNVVAP